MNFFDAMKELEKGNKVRNANWLDTIFLYKENNKIYFSDICLEKYLSPMDLNYGVWELYKEPILDKTEKEYLSNVIKPFKNNVLYIIKLKGLYDNIEYIQIGVKTDNVKRTEYINLPFFIGGSMYNNMKLNHEYSLKELGLDD